MVHHCYEGKTLCRPFSFFMYHYKEEKAMKIKPFAVEEWMNA